MYNYKDKWEVLGTFNSNRYGKIALIDTHKRGERYVIARDFNKDPLEWYGGETYYVDRKEAVRAFAWLIGLEG